MNETPLHILLIEDNPGDARFVQEILKDAAPDAFQVIHAASLSQGLSRLSASPFDVILLDLTLPDSSGLSTFYRIYNEKPFVPVIILSGCDDEQMAVHAVSDGAQDYLVKGHFEDQLLVRAIRYAIKRNEQNQTIHALKDFHQRIVQNLTEGIIVGDNQGLISYVNPAVPRILGYQSNELMGKPCTWFIRSDMRPVLEKAVSHWVHGHQKTVEIELKKKKGPSVPVLMNGSFYEQDGGTGFIAVITEISRLKETEIQIQNAHHALLDKYRVRNNLLITLARNTQADPEISDMISRLSRLDRMESPAGKEELNLGLELERVHHDWKFRFQEKNTALNFEMPDEAIHVETCGDTLHHLLKLMCQTLLDESDSTQPVEMSLEDRGTCHCLAWEAPASLAQAYRALNAPSPDNLNGSVALKTLLRLALIREWAAKHGTFRVESAEGGQCRLELEFEKGRSPEILIVDDAPKIVDIVKRFLNPLGVKFAEASNGHDALARIESQKPALVMLDLMLPRMSGYDVLRHLRSREEFRNLPVLVMSAFPVEDETLRRWQSEGPVTILEKPLDPGQLVGTVNDFLKSHTTA